MLRINLVLGDWLYWHDSRAISYRGSFRRWEQWLECLIIRRKVTDIVYFADCTPYHKAARRLARRLGIRAISYEYGYLRPDWILFEPGGQSAASHFPVAMDRIRRLAGKLSAPDLSRRFEHDVAAESRGDVIYHLANYLMWPLYPRYRRDRMYNPIAEYLSYPIRFWRARRAAAKSKAVIGELLRAKDPFFVVPLQMQNDYQIRANSPWQDQREFLCVVLASFGEFASPQAKLVVKVHPLDNGLENWRRSLENMIAKNGLRGRVVLLDGGNLEELVTGAAGMVVINSTSGIAALRMDCPVKVVGCATYDIEGLTHRGTLDTFWKAPFQASPKDVAAFLSVMANYVHVRGDFYDPKGRRAAVQAAAERLLQPEIWKDVFDPIPPRREAARRMGLETDL